MNPYSGANPYTGMFFATQQLTLKCAKHVFRRGVVSIIPSPALELYTCSSLRKTIVGMTHGSDCRVSLALSQALRTHASYASGAKATDRHVKLFWLAVAELSATQIHTLLSLIWGADTPAELYQLKAWALATISTSASSVASATNNMNLDDNEIEKIDGRENDIDEHRKICYDVPEPPLPLSLMGPTAVALLSPDTTKITVFSQQHAISLPRYSSLKVMRHQLNQLVGR